MIIATSPSRVSLFGGGTDIPEFADKYGGRVLNMAINLKHTCTLQTTLRDDVSKIIAIDEVRRITEVPKRHMDDKFDLIYEVLRSYCELPKFIFEDKFEGVQSAGLGSSASAAVSMIGAFNRLLGIKMSKMDIAHKAWRSEINLGWISGKQDQYACAIGGMNMMEFSNGDVWIDEIPRKIAEAFSEWCVLVYTGKKRHSSDIQKGLKDRLKDESAIRSMLELRNQTWVARDLLSQGDYSGVGKLLRKAWETKKDTNPLVTNPEIDDIFTRAYKLGAVGGKVLGAGGNGCILFVVNPTRRDIFIKELGLQNLEFSVDFNGLQVRKCP